MTMATDDVIETLNDLIETSRDGEQGFRTCAQGLLVRISRCCSSSCQTLCRGRCGIEAKVRGLGGSPRRAVLQVGRCIALGST